MSEAPIISLNIKFDREKFERISAKELILKRQNKCSHDETTFDGELDLVQCDSCKKEWSCFDYLWYWVEKGKNPSMKVYQIENAIHFLTEEKRKLEDDIFYLKKERRAIKTEITKLKK